MRSSFFSDFSGEAGFFSENYFEETTNAGTPLKNGLFFLDYKSGRNSMNTPFQFRNKRRRILRTF
ncbi:hypothetical protein DLM75_00165 [Leptospira stimsonii]|uniref:Uncharacterized protein n=1 Tax=Leptospira stimsonii TaxID=2202203 RepID=A0A396ZF24_9LEPT|nr:hypothetical protein DLM75_00165 [Leptospira stimsonii]